MVISGTLSTDKILKDNFISYVLFIFALYIRYILILKDLSRKT